MIPITEIPGSGMFMLIVRFDGYKDNYQNDTRKRFIDIPRWINDTDIQLKQLKIEPISFSLIKSVSQGVSRASGAIQIYSFVGLNPAIYKRLHTELAGICNKLSWWRSWNLLIAQDVSMEE